MRATHVALKWLGRIRERVGDKAITLGCTFLRMGKGRDVLNTADYLISYSAKEIILEQNNSLYRTTNGVGWSSHRRHSPGKNTGVGFHFLLQGILPDPGIEPRSPALERDSLPSEL